MKATPWLALIVASLLAGPGFAQDRQVFTPNPAATPPLPYSPAVKVNGIIYVAGQIAPEAGADPRAQVEAVLKKVQVVVEAAGSSMPRVDKCSVFLVSAADFAAMNEVWRKFFPASPPARTTVMVAALPGSGSMVEIDCTAH